MSRSVARVKDAAEALGIPIEVLRLGTDMRTAEAAATALNCDVARIAKSLVFLGAHSNTLYLLLVSGARLADLDRVAEIVGEPLTKADAQHVRARSGFVIGGVAPIGHLEAPRVLIDDTLMTYRTVWAASGAPDALFEIAPPDLVKATAGDVSQITQAIS